MESIKRRHSLIEIYAILGFTTCIMLILFTTIESITPWSFVQGQTTSLAPSENPIHEFTKNNLHEVIGDPFYTENTSQQT